MSREGKIHLVESFASPKKLYKNITNNASQNLKEAAQRVHKKLRIAEATVFDSANKKTLKENDINTDVQNRVIEHLKSIGADTDELEIWQFPVSRINDKQHPNLNGRVYGRKLWENVIEKQREVWEGGTGLANHPKDDEEGDFMKQSIVWLDGFIGDDGFVYGIGTLIGDGGKLARQILGLGGRVGFSTSGYGDFLADGVEVDPESYEIDRFADLVLAPSQGVFGDITDLYGRNNNKKVTVTVESTNRRRQENVKIVAKKALKENNMRRNVKMNLKEDTNIAAVVKAVNTNDTIKQLCKIADDLGLEVTLQEDAEIDLTAELSTKVMANIIKDWTEEDCNEDNLKDVQDTLTLLTDKGFDDEEISQMFKTALTDAGAKDAVIEAIFNSASNKKEEAESETTKDEAEADGDENNADAEADAETGAETNAEANAEANAESDAEEDDTEDSGEQLNELSLADQLMSEHYIKSLKAIDKKSNELWEEKIAELESLTAKLKEAKLSNSVKTKLNNQTQKLVDNIMKEARAAIQEGFKAKKICNDLGINTISKLSNVKEKLEDFVALEECLNKATKEANKYKALYEAKSDFANTEAEEAYDKDETIKGLKDKIAKLHSQLAESYSVIRSSKKANDSMKRINESTDKDYQHIKNEKIRISKNYGNLVEKYSKLKEILAEANKTISALKKESAIKGKKLLECKTKILELSKELNESSARQATLAEHKAKLIKKNNDLLESLNERKEKETQKIRQEKLAEAKAHIKAARSQHDFYDSNKMFNNSKAIENYLESKGIKDTTNFKSAKTVREAENKLLFSNELLDENADRARDSIDVPRESIESLADMFN